MQGKGGVEFEPDFINQSGRCRLIRRLNRKRPHGSQKLPSSLLVVGTFGGQRIKRRDQNEFRSVFKFNSDGLRYQSRNSYEGHRTPLSHMHSVFS